LPSTSARKAREYVSLLVGPYAAPVQTTLAAK
jgi:hypothetical protein